MASNEFLNKIYRKTENIVTRNIADETLLVPIRGNLADMQKIFSLNPAAEFIWRHLDGKLNLREIQSELTQTYEVDQADAEKDIRELIEQLVGFELVKDIAR